MSERPVVQFAEIQELANEMLKVARNKASKTAVKQAQIGNVLDQLAAAMKGAGVMDTANLQAVLAGQIEAQIAKELEAPKIRNTEIADAANTVWIELSKRDKRTTQPEVFEATAARFREHGRNVEPEDVKRALRSAGTTLQDAPLWAYGFVKLVERIGYEASRAGQSRVEVLEQRVQDLERELRRHQHIVG